MNDVQISKIYTFVRYLGLLIDWKLNWNAHFREVILNGRAVYRRCYTRYRNASHLLAGPLCIIYKTYVIPKITYLVELWWNSTHILANKLISLYDDIIRHCNGSESYIHYL